MTQTTPYQSSPSIVSPPAQARQMDAYLDVAGRYLPEALISAADFRNIRQLAAHLPIAPLTIFESHLGEGKEGLDFLICTPPHWVQQPEVRSLAASSPAWQSITALCDQWLTEPASAPFRQAMDSIWLEFDTSQQTEHQIEPGILFASMELSANQVQDQTQAQTIWATLAALCPNKVNSPEFVFHMEKIMKSLPPNGRIYALGDMAGRQSEYTRIAIAHISNTAVIPFLQNINWPGDFSQVATLLEQIKPFNSEVSLDLDVGSTIGSTLGLELVNRHRFDRMWWQQLFAFLVNKELCTPEKSAALRQWPGHSNETNNPAIWPNQLLPTAHLQKPINCFLVRFINHVKLVCRPNMPLQAKAYIALRQACQGSKSKQV
ncbi:MAG: hypothetical protein H6653_10070 [Ardenticatenaceae bacterium]|nr:hypothetical protein [Ardenticatenaceae bacterium]